MRASSRLHCRPVVAAAAAYRGAREADRRDAIEALATAIRTVAVSTSSGFPNVRAPIREEIVQDRTARLVRHICDGKARPGREDGLVRTAVKNALRDHLRRQRHDALEQAGSLQDRPAVALERLEPRSVALVEQLASESYGEVLRWTLVEERPLGELVERDLRARIAEGLLDPQDLAAVARGRSSLRNRRDKQWQRGRDALLRLVIDHNRDLLETAPTDLRDVLVAAYLERRRCAEQAQTLARGRRWFLRSLLSLAS